MLSRLSLDSCFLSYHPSYVNFQRSKSKQKIPKARWCQISFDLKTVYPSGHCDQSLKRADIELYYQRQVTSQANNLCLRVFLKTKTVLNASTSMSLFNTYSFHIYAPWQEILFFFVLFYTQVINKTDYILYSEHVHYSV